MIENAKRQVALVIVLVLASLASLYYKGIVLGLDLKGGTELIYQVDRDKVEDPDGELDWGQFMVTMVTVIRERIDPKGTLGAQVSRRGENGIYIAIPLADAAKAKEVEAKITRLGSLEMQICAYENKPNLDGTMTFKSGDLAEEKKRLEAWLAKDKNKEKLAKDPLKVEQFHQLSEADGGPIIGSDKLRWVPRKIQGGIQSNGSRGENFEQSRAGGEGVGQFIVTLFDPSELGEKVTEEKPFLVEYFPINYSETGFTGKDLEANMVRPSYDQDGSPVVLYVLKGTKASSYADVSEHYVQHQSAIILDGILKVSPTYISRIPGRGQIQGFTEPEAKDLSEVLKRGSLQIKPDRQSLLVIGPTLGQDSIDRGKWSLIIGSALVLLFILFYYRIAGIVATVGVVLNVGFVFGAVSFMEATLTLPGLGGLVLTIGMAVDANILIYERIREELKHGKELVLAVRHGFERAMVTILDANVTTFIAGLVLYNFGVGPIRGFAVTLMIGIVTSLFTAFFISRLIFHFLLERKVQGLHMTEWFGGLRLNFLKFTRVAFAFSLIAITAGLVLFFATDSNKKYALDFTGGADVRVVAENPMTAKELGDRIAKDAAFSELFPKPLINTIEEGNDGRSRKFSVKLKVGAKLAAQIAMERAEAKKKGEPYQPLYAAKLGEALKDVLVPKAFTDATITEKEKGSRTNFAMLRVHSSKDLEVSKVAGILEKSIGDTSANIVVTAMVNGTPDKTATASRDLRLEFDVPKKIATPEELVRFASEKLRSDAGAATPETPEDETPDELELSDPIPDVQELGSQIVGELRMAAFGALLVALFCIVMYIRVRFREYKYGLAAVAAVAHDVLVALGLIVLFNRFDLVSAELSLSMIAAFLTIIGYSINDTIVIFDRIRENLAKQEKLGDSTTSFADTINLSINQTLSRTILTSCTTLFVVGALLAVNYGAGSELEGFAFAMIIGVITGTYSTMFIASPIVMWLRSREKPDAGLSDDGGLGELEAEDDAAPGALPAIT